MKKRAENTMHYQQGGYVSRPAFFGKSFAEGGWVRNPNPSGGYKFSNGGFIDPRETSERLLAEGAKMSRQETAETADKAQATGENIIQEGSEGSANKGQGDKAIAVDDMSFDQKADAGADIAANPAIGTIGESIAKGLMGAFTGMAPGVGTAQTIASKATGTKTMAAQTYSGAKADTKEMLSAHADREHSRGVDTPGIEGSTDIESATLGIGTPGSQAAAMAAMDAQATENENQGDAPGGTSSGTDTSDESDKDMAPFAEGGEIEGPGGPTDDAIPAVIDGEIPAALSDGEFVMTAAAVKKFGPEFFELLNKIASFEAEDNPKGPSN